MLPKTEVFPEKTISDYRKIIPTKTIWEIKKLKKELKGLKVAHLNATPKGGGVAEILKALVPLMRSQDIKTEWYTIPPKKDFFDVTKKVHNALQGKAKNLTRKEKEIYLDYNEKIAKLMRKIDVDVWIVHDPQPMATIQFLKKKAKMVSRVHIDTTLPQKSVWSFFSQFLEQYDRAIFSVRDFVPEGFLKEKVRIFPPAIDPLSLKNREIDKKILDEIIAYLGLDLERPIIAQVARFDPWKDPKGVIDAYRIAKKKVPELQLVYAGLIIAQDDPEAKRILREVQKYAGGDSDIHLFYDPREILDFGVDLFVNSIQRRADVILQKSIKEGFGLSVTEAMWKKKAVVGGNVGGIKTQIEDGKNGFLVASPEKAGERIVELIRDSQLRERLGRAAKITVKKKFLLPRLLRDYLKLFRELLAIGQ